MMTSQEKVEETIAFIKRIHSNAESGHDWWHTYRVLNTSRIISKNYSVNNLLIDLGALLHDIADAKFHKGDEEIGPAMAMKYLKTLDIEETLINKIIDIIRFISFKNKDLKKPNFIEFKIIQDADRLDALGAIGIARAFSYGGYKRREMYNPDISPDINLSDEQYKKHKGPTINHFYEKLFMLKEMLNTPEAREIAEKRQNFMQMYLSQFYTEWKGEDLLQ